MNDTNPTKITEWVWRRTADPFRVFGLEVPGQVWWAVLALVLVVAFFYIVLMYRKDSRGVGPAWATLLGLLRAAVYLCLAWVFMLRAEQTWEETQSRSKVLVLLDTSLSMGETRDDIPTDSTPLEKLLTRQDKVLAFLADPAVNFLGRLEARNPVTVYRFGRDLDEDFRHFAEGRNWTAAEWKERQRNPEADADTEPAPLAPEFWQSWLKPAARLKAPETWGEAGKVRFQKQVEANEQKLKDGFFNGTNLGTAAERTVSREINNMVQGMVIFTDGRSTEGSAQAFHDLEQRARSARIPVFVVGVGEERPQVRIDIVDLRVPEQVQPEDKFRAVVEVTGEGLADKEFQASLELVYTKKDKNGKEEPLDLTLVEAPDKADPNKQREVVVLGKSLTLLPSGPPKFDRGTPPRAEVEFQLDAASLAKAAGKESSLTGKKWELGETKEGEIKFRARVPKDRLEIFAGKLHESDPADLRVIKKPLRVLLFASGPMHEYQFVRTLLVREMEKKRAEVSIYLQPPPGRAEKRPGVVQDVPPERLLATFPNRLDSPSDKPDEKLYDLGEYDVIVAFDPDWTQLSEEQLKLVERWVDKGGGLIVVGGPINTLQLAAPEANKEKLKPILDLYPVVLKDVRIEELERTTNEQWPLIFDGATPEMEFLKLAEEGPDGPPPFLSDWHEFFYGDSPDGKTLQRGFYSYYPVERAKTGAQVVARFADPRAKLKDGTLQPYLVLSDPASGRRVVWIGSGEIRRLRGYREAYYERFWTKLCRYAGAGNQGKINKRITPNFGRTFTANQFVVMEAKIDNKGGEPLPRSAKPAVKLKLPPGVPEKEVPTDLVMSAKPGSEGWFSVRFQVRSPGEYGMELRVPETGDTFNHRFTVKEANPELDNTRPDFDQMYQLASVADEVVLPRMNEADRLELRKRLQRPKLEQTGDKKEGREAGQEEKPRLYFTLKNADWIPNCMVTDLKTNRSRGPIKDQWDDGFVIPGLGTPDQPVKLSYVLAAVVGLLSMEWLIRKLLRLA